MRITVITINYNDMEGLRETLRSVAEQVLNDGLSLEHIIIDGASTDGSVEVIREYAESHVNSDQPSTSRLSDSNCPVGKKHHTPSAIHHPPYTIIWKSEPDTGIYNAINKGIRMATGDYIQILNSGDIFASNDVLSQMFDAIKPYTMHHTPYTDNMGIFYGNMLAEKDGRRFYRSKEVEYSLLNYYRSTMNHDCCWIKRTLFVKENEDENQCYGLYDENLKIVSDWKWFLQAIGLGGVKPVYVDVDMTVFDLGGISETQLERCLSERRTVLEEVVPHAVLADYDRHAFDMEQMDRLRRHHLYWVVYLIERVLFKLEKWNIL